MLNITQVPDGPTRSKNLQAPTEVSCKMRRNQGRGRPGRGFTTTTPEPGGHVGEDQPERSRLFLLLLHQLISLTKGTEVGNSSEPGDPKKCYVGSHLGASAQSPNGTRGSCRTSSSPASFCPYKKFAKQTKTTGLSSSVPFGQEGGRERLGVPQALDLTSEALAEGGSRAPSLQLPTRGCNLAVILPPSHNCCQRGKLPGTPRPPSSAVAASHAAPSRAQGTAGRTSSALAEGKAARQRGQLPVAVRVPLG